jgi:hypothetical protein
MSYFYPGRAVFELHSFTSSSKKLKGDFATLMSQQWGYVFTE